VSNLSHSSAGHYYFTVKDDQSQLRCVMFRSQHGGEMLTNGGAVIVHGRLSLYPTRGDLQLYVDLVQPEGTGALALELERMKAQLEEEGLFEPSRKRPLPVFPRKVGVVTSPTGAVFHDICNVIDRRYPLVEVVLSPTPVQGSEAAQGIVEALQTLNNLGDIDVIIVARGGGSLEELWPFNAETVVRAIYGSRVPVISGVGHETDTTLSDLVADLRAPTPSAAAELVVPNATQLQAQIVAHQRTAIYAITSRLSQSKQELEATTQRLVGTAPQVDLLRQRTDDLAQGLSRTLGTHIALAGERFGGLEQRLNALNPQAVLTRGYALVQRADDGTLVTEKAQVKKDDPLKITVSDGSFDARSV
jgi:exodeoxyribonuclease VII large subunit